MAINLSKVVEMIWEAWLTVIVVVACFVALARNRISPDVIMMAGLGVLLISGVLTPKQALAGLANEGMVTVAILYVVVTGIKETGGLSWIVENLLGKPASRSHAQIKLMAPVAIISAFLNNTPVVALYVPAVQDWAKRYKLPVSQLMIPLSYASIAGGTCTLIGTSTNLLVNGLLIQETGTQALQMFDLMWIGVPVTIMVLGFVLLFSERLLPDRTPAITRFGNLREYTVEMEVEAESVLNGRSIEQAGLRQLSGLYLIEIEREGIAIPAVSPNETLREYDLLIFAGVPESVVDLQKIKGLKPATQQIDKLDTPRHRRCLIEAVVSDHCPLVGKTVRKGKFRTRYNAAVIAVARNGRRIRTKIGDIALHPGDNLLLEARPSFVEQQRHSRDFLLVSQLSESTAPRHDRAPMAAAILMLMVVLVGFGWLSMLKSAMLAAGLMLLFRCTSERLARRAVDWQVLIVIAASFGIGSALEVTGAAGEMAQNLLSIVNGNPATALAAVFLMTALLSALATNNVAAVLMFPISVATSQSLGVSILPFAITIMIGASASFATPIGYQTNLMVYGVGGYRFSDFVRIGLPLTALVGLLTIFLVPIIWPFIVVPGK
ncbi:MAG: SLC13 family permease [Gammaproteobacteria bacterium]